MNNDKFDIAKINNSIKSVEKEFNKIDEWFIPRDRKSFYLTHDFHPYFAAYPPELVSKLLNKYSKKGEVFLDPFMGGGSSVVEGFTNQRVTIGIDISPLANFISKVKTKPFKINEKEIHSLLADIKIDIFNQKLKRYEHFSYKIPQVTNIDKWFSKESKYDLAIILHQIQTLKDEDPKNFLLLAFSSIIRKVSNAKNAQQHLCIKKGKKIPPVYPCFEKKVLLMIDQMKEYVNNLGDISNYKLPTLHSYDIRIMTEIIPKNSVDIIITSPPYGTGLRYTDVNRLNFEWLELSKPKKNETMETSKDFKFELKRAMQEMYDVLKEGKYCFIVYGDPSTEDSLTRAAITDALEVGFTYEGLISCPIEKTVGNHHEKYRRFIPKDFILIFKK